MYFKDIAIGISSVADDSGKSFQKNLRESFTYLLIMSCRFF